jgi:hypothetical protein
MARQGFISRVIDHLLQNMQWIFSACIHARPLADGFQAFQDPDGCFVVM